MPLAVPPPVDKPVDGLRVSCGTVVDRLLHGTLGPPFGLVDSVGLTTPLVVGIVSYTFFGLDTLGDQIEDPFDTLPNDLPLDALCHTIKSNLQMLLGEPLTTGPQPDANGVLL